MTRVFDYVKRGGVALALAAATLLPACYSSRSANEVVESNKVASESAAGSEGINSWRVSHGVAVSQPRLSKANKELKEAWDEAKVIAPDIKSGPETWDDTLKGLYGVRVEKNYGSEILGGQLWFGITYAHGAGKVKTSDEGMTVYGVPGKFTLEQEYKSYDTLYGGYTFEPGTKLLGFLQPALGAGINWSRLDSETRFTASMPLAGIERKVRARFNENSFGPYVSASLRGRIPLDFLGNPTLALEGQYLWNSLSGDAKGTDSINGASTPFSQRTKVDFTGPSLLLWLSWDF